MKKPTFLSPFGLTALGVLPMTLAMTGCGTATSQTAEPVDSIVVPTAVPIPPAENADATAAPEEAAGKPAPGGAKGATPKPAAKSAATGKPDPAYRIATDGPPGIEKLIVPPPPIGFKVPANAKVKFDTTKGTFTIQLNTKEAPLHTKSFYYLVKRGFYNGITFHRYADLTMQGGYIIQGGDPFTRSAETKMYAGQGGPGYEIPRERNKLTHEKLVIAAARSQDPDSAGSQFYFTFAPVPFLDEGDGYTVFGKVVEGGNNVLKLREDDVIKKATAQ